MSRIAYVNGHYLPQAHAAVSMEDRGLQFADGIYEVMEVFNHQIVDETPHLDRLERSLNEIRIPMPMSRAALRQVLKQLLRRNGRADCLIYLQINRGQGMRDHNFPKHPQPTIMTGILPARTPSLALYQSGASAITQPDMRWGRCDVKSVALLPNILAKQKATEASAREALLVGEDGTVREGSSSNLYIITQKGELWTHPADQRILPGILRMRALQIAAEHQITIQEKPFNQADLASAREVFITSTSAHILPITKIDGKAVGDGKPGPLTLRLLAAYHDHILKQTGKQCPTPQAPTPK